MIQGHPKKSSIKVKNDLFQLWILLADMVLSMSIFFYSERSQIPIFLSCLIKNSYCGQEDKARSLRKPAFESPMSDVYSNVFVEN